MKPRIRIEGAETRAINIDVLPQTLFMTFLNHLAEQLFPDRDCRPTTLYRESVYINSDGMWERWEDDHGSGYTTTLRKATKEEKKAMKTWHAVQELRKHF